MGRLRAVALAAILLAPAARADLTPLTQAWPAPNGDRGQAVTFASTSPYLLTDIGRGPERQPPTQAVARLFLPPHASVARPVPAVVMLHGAGGVLSRREMTYGPQYAAMGVAALVVDVFAARRDMASGFTERLLNITETMMLADAYAALRYLAARPEVDGDRVALVGFSYGAMASTFALHAQVADRLAGDGRRFAAHVAFYGPCLARFDRRETTGAPLLMLWGGRDDIIDAQRCREIAADLEAGGSRIQIAEFADAYHQWDGSFRGPVRLGANLAPCRLVVRESGRVQDRRTWLIMIGPLSRRLILAACADRDGYRIGRDDDVRQRANAVVGGFLSRAFAGASPP